MSKGRSKEKPNRRKMTLSLEAPNAKEVMVVGDFNTWNATTHPMKQDEAGVWKKMFMLPPGRYEYKFLVDGRWRNDSKNDQVCPNCYGSLNNVLTIS